jgi:HlyD family secretion protein
MATPSPRSIFVFCTIPALVFLLGCGPSAAPEAAPSAEAAHARIERIVVATGTIEPKGEVWVRPRIAGIVDQILVEAGDDVEAGQVLIEIERELREAFTAEARAGVEAAQVEVRYAKIAVGRSDRLKDQGASSDSQHDEARADYDRAVAALARARAAYETLEVQLRYASVRAPVSGRVLDVVVEIGDAVSPVTSVTGGTVLLSLASKDLLNLIGQVDENDVSRIEQGQPARLRTEAYGDRTFAGHVAKIAPVGHRIQNVTYFEVEIEITDPDAGLLRPRMSGDAEIVAETLERALVIPETALRYAGETIFVNVVGEGEEPGIPPERRDVEVGVVDGNRVQILSGLSPGERVSLQ